jgi:tripartite-type tricarboxylate transporter receptor subunit TctC
MGRLLAHELSRRLGQNVVVENKAGANGQIAATAVARSAPDGYTLFMTTNSTHGANPHLYRKLSYDPIADFVPIARTAMLPFMLVVSPTLPVETTRELIAHARTHPGTLAYGTASTASLVGAETINHLAGIDMLQVGYRSSPQALLDLTAGRFQVMVADFATAMPHVRAGRIRVLAVTTAKRSTLLPEVPPIAEALSGFDLTSWNGLFAPAGTPLEIVARVERETLAALAQPALQKKLAAIGFEVDPMDAKRFGTYVREQIEYWGKLVRAANIQPE